ncbi:MAG: hypothetical protein J3K34DRAFT_518210 [Monoraphidium minutum]|nr:MAG: hypothetical protein J3K34DRAFT_518210 [Monoraphidium minutum]
MGRRDRRAAPWLLGVSAPVRAQLALLPLLLLSASFLWAPAAPTACKSEWQIVMCADVPVSDTARLDACCRDHLPPPPAAAAVVTAAAAQADAAAAVARPDLDPDSGPYSEPLDWLFGSCVPQATAEVLAFSRDEEGRTLAQVDVQPVPALSASLIRRIKARALRAAPAGHRLLAARLKQRTAGAARRGAAGGGGDAAAGGAAGEPFAVPGGYAGPAELATLQWRLAQGSPLQAAAKDSLLTGRWVPRNVKGRNGWHLPVTLPPEGYGGPYAMKELLVDIGGTVKNTSACPPNFPPNANLAACGHTAFVELDAAMAYKYALGYAATGDERYAARAAEILRAWTTTNEAFGLPTANGPLEAAWGCAALSRAMELLRSTWPAFDPSDLDAFVSWAHAKLVPNMDYFVDTLSAYPRQGYDKRKLLYGNWHASHADCFVALGVLSGDRPRYDKGLDLYRTTVESYFKWGRDGYAPGRLLGEATETLRDIYHTLFGIGSLIQAAETVWGQDEDAYSESGYVLAAALELHARIINAHLDGDEAGLPPGFRFFESMPPPPKGCAWRWAVPTQAWASYNASSGAKCSDLTDGLSYALGIKYLPTGFELGYNHFAGRLGMQLPETRRLLSRYPVDYFEFCWGSCTLTHADTAGPLWRAGVTRAALCGGGQRPFLDLVDPLDAFEGSDGDYSDYGNDAKGGPRGQKLPSKRVQLPGLRVKVPDPIAIVGRFFGGIFGR